MNLHPAMTSEAIRARLENAARETYGEERTVAMTDQLQHLSEMLAIVAGQELDLRESPLPGPDRDDRSGQ